MTKYFCFHTSISPQAHLLLSNYSSNLFRFASRSIWLNILFNCWLQLLLTQAGECSYQIQKNQQEAMCLLMQPQSG